VSKPIDLIVANTMHEVVGQIASANKILELLSPPGKARALEIDAQGREAIARKMLCNIAHDASLSNVLKALKLLGAPHSHDDISEGVNAVMEASE